MCLASAEGGDNLQTGGEEEEEKSVWGVGFWSEQSVHTVINHLASAASSLYTPIVFSHTHTPILNGSCL